MTVAGEHQVRPQEGILGGKAVVPVGQEQPEGVAFRGVELGGKLLRGLLVGVAVGVVDAGEDDGVAVSREGHVLVGKHRDPRGGQGLFQGRDFPHSPLVVAGYVIGGGDGAQARADGLGIALGVAPEAVLQVPQVENVFRLLRRHRCKKGAVSRAKLRAVEVAEDHDAAAVKAVGEVGEGDVKIGPLRGGIFPNRIGGKGQHQQGKDAQAAFPAAFFRFSCHGALLCAVFYSFLLYHSSIRVAREKIYKLCTSQPNFPHRGVKKLLGKLHKDFTKIL